MNRMVCAYCVLFMVRATKDQTSQLLMNGRPTVLVDVQRVCEDMVFFDAIVVVNNREMHMAITTNKGVPCCAGHLMEKHVEPSEERIHGNKI